MSAVPSTGPLRLIVVPFKTKSPPIPTKVQLADITKLPFIVNDDIPETEYDKIIDSGDIDHGIISSLAILYIIDLMYQKYNPKREDRDVYVPSTNINVNQKYFEGDVVSACTAIYIHNLPKRSFVNSKINRSKAPVAFLLKLSDCLQDWERPSKINPTGFSATKFDIKIDNDQLIFQADIPDDKKKQIKDEISSSLVAPDVQIC